MTAWARIFKITQCEIEFVRANTIDDSFIKCSFVLMGEKYNDVFIRQSELEDLEGIEDLDLYVDMTKIEQARWN